MVIFVYGTLMSGLRLSHILDSSEFLGEAIVGEVCLYNLGPYPAIKQGDGAVVGEIYHVTNAILDQLDMVEGYTPNNLEHSLYHRQKIKILLPAISSEVFAYFYNSSVQEVDQIESGDYRSYVQSITR